MPVDPAPGGDPLATPYLDANTIERAVGISDALERNAAITRGYHELSEAMAAIQGRDHANWLTFGQWASAEARRSISGEAVPTALRGLLGEGVTRAVANGNAAIFHDVAPPFVRFVHAFAPLVSGSTDPEPDAVRAALAGLCAHPQLTSSPDPAWDARRLTPRITSPRMAPAGRSPAASPMSARPSRGRPRS